MVPRHRTQRSGSVMATTTTTINPPVRPPKLRQDKEPAYPRGQRVRKIAQGTDYEFFKASIAAKRIHDCVPENNHPPIGAIGTIVASNTAPPGAICVVFDGFPNYSWVYSPLDALRCLEPVKE